jgi:hypothetical protein
MRRSVKRTQIRIYGKYSHQESRVSVTIFWNFYYN